MTKLEDKVNEILGIDKPEPKKNYTKPHSGKRRDQLIHKQSK